jgi:hypothetical protein
MKHRRVEVNGHMLPGYVYLVAEPIGRPFYQDFRRRLPIVASK